MTDPLLETTEDTTVKPDSEAPRKRYVLKDDAGFDEVPRKYRRFYRRWDGAKDVLAPNEVLCPVCKVVIRSNRELRPGDRVYCMPCMSRLIVTKTEAGTLEATVSY
ncbi:MAG: hypothetical protein GY944_16530 [bacterium]|nr:hypothetical protein [bacterium]